MARAKRHSVCWTICYVNRLFGEDYTATWFAYGKTAEEAKENFLRNMEASEDAPREMFPVLNVFEGFSA